MCCRFVGIYLHLIVACRQVADVYTVVTLCDVGGNDSLTCDAVYGGISVGLAVNMQHIVCRVRVDAYVVLLVQFLYRQCCVLVEHRKLTQR